MDQYHELFARLAATFPAGSVKDMNKGGTQIRYVTARVIMNRLDDVLGPANWWDEYIPQGHSVLCRLTVRLPDGSTLTKCDAGGSAGMKDAGDDDKSAHSDALKRAAVKFGVGRYLYNDGRPKFVQPTLDRLREEAAEKRPSAGTLSTQPEPEPTPPTAPEPAPAAPEPARAPVRPATPPTAPHPDNRPTSGKTLYGWLRKISDRDKQDYLGPTVEYGKAMGWPEKMLDWTRDQVDATVAGVLGEEVVTS